MMREFLQRAAGQRAHWVERDISQQFHPNLVAKARGNRAAKSGGDQGRRDPAQSIGLRPVGLAEADLVALGVSDDAGLDNISREVHQRSDDAPRLDGRGDNAARIDTLQSKAVELAAMRLEIP